jgi:N-sulfoglucosamine sulfohydrolase
MNHTTTTRETSKLPGVRATLLGIVGAAALVAFPLNTKAAPTARPNIVFITADDLNYDSTGCYGCRIRDLTPNIDRLATEGVRFQYAFSTVAVCQPVREIMHSGRYPHRSGAMGFFPLKPEVRTLNQQLHDAGYLISMFGKNGHYMPVKSFPVDYEEKTINRHPAQLAAATKKFIGMARAQGKPFFHHVNCGDPHHPLIGAKGPDDLADGDAPSRWITPAEVTEVPGFLEDLPEVRREMAQYYTNVKRLDDCVGAVLKALDETGQRGNTIVMFYGGDHGMAWPFAKSNDYENSSRGGLLVRWPGVVSPGLVDTDHLVSTLDFTPTLLDATGVTMIPDMDGRSFLPALKGVRMPGWDRVYTFYNQGGIYVWMTMRCVRTKDRSYIWNGWSDGKTEYQAGLWSEKGAIMKGSSLAWPAMFRAAKTNPAIKARVDLLIYRVPEEFYDMSSDRFERNNLIADAGRQKEIEALRSDLLALMRRTGDPFADAFAQRNDRSVYLKTTDKLSEVYYNPAKKKASDTAKKKAAQR